MANLKQIYQNQCELGLIEDDQVQLDALDHFQLVCDALSENEKRAKSWFKRSKPVKGLYIWGGVGIGKTYLMDIFFENAPTQAKMRLHFHAFMKLVHNNMQQFRGQPEPVKKVAKALADNYQLICFDEFFVTEIVDAMILARLLEALIEYGVCFVATSNTAPDDLYKNGLQRISFLPAIKLLNEHTHVVHLQSDSDYRLKQVTKAGVYFSPDDDKAEMNLTNLFSMLAHGYCVNEDPLNIHGRWINVRKRAEHIVWFDFADICQVPRSQQDYLALVERFDTFFVSHVPHIPTAHRNIVSLFIRFIDVLYDRNIPLFMSLQTSVKEMCGKIDIFPEYERTQSRLLEMQSEKYLKNRL